MIGMKFRNVWIDSVWLPTLSYTMARRAYQEWLESMPSDRILWGADTVQAEGIYAATEFTRQCLAESACRKGPTRRIARATCGSYRSPSHARQRSEAVPKAQAPALAD